MLTEDEKKFVAYWENNRNRRKKVVKQLAIGLPLAVVIVVAIFVNFFSGWYKRADMIVRSQGSQSSLILVLVVAAILIVAFIVIFSAKHQWDMNEQRYREFLAKKDQP